MLHQYRQFLAHLYTRKGFDETRLFVHRDGMSFVACPCYYCGEVATSEDHAYPLIALSTIYGLEDLPSPYLLVVVPACHECNLLLSSKVFPSMARRKRYVKQRLRQRHKQLLALPDWHPQELLTLSPRLREYVELGIWQRENLEKRLSW